MPATRFDLVSHWYLPAPLDRVWAEIAAPEQWPAWWRAVKRVELLREGDAAGIGAVRRLTWSTALPYTIVIDTETTRIVPNRLIEGRATGELNGGGLWTLAPVAEGTHVRYDWQVELQLSWQRALAPVLRPVFAWNHAVVMGWGEAGIRTRLGL
ncbi:MAG TPA: hypothetical protein GYA10_02645 [Alphaproteobacteria bacterium]|nr:hypothetical protein [Alphaproteobacteria bacterium]